MVTSQNVVNEVNVCDFDVQLRYLSYTSGFVFPHQQTSSTTVLCDDGRSQGVDEETVDWIDILVPDIT